MTKTAGLYGGSLYELAVSEGIDAQLRAELETVDQLLCAYPEWLRLLEEPSIPKKERLALMDEAFDGQLHLYLQNFLKLLCENGLLRMFHSCAKVFYKRYNEAHGIAEARAVSAVPLTDMEAEALQKKLEAISGKQVVLSQKVDPKVLGGLRVEFEDYALDGTTKNRLAGMRKAILGSTAADNLA